MHGKKRIALVTGDSRGPGRDMALSLSKKGIDVILTCNTNKQEADNVVNTTRDEGGKAVALQFDVSKTSKIDTFLVETTKVLKEYRDTDKFDFLVNNAGTGASIPIAELTEETFDNFIDIHFKGVYFLTHKALNLMNDGGGVVFIS